MSAKNRITYFMQISYSYNTTTKIETTITTTMTTTTIIRCGKTNKFDLFLLFCILDIHVIYSVAVGTLIYSTDSRRTHLSQKKAKQRTKERRDLNRTDLSHRHLFMFACKFCQLLLLFIF